MSGVSHGECVIDDVLVFYANTHDPATAGEVDADAAPSYEVYERETGTPILTGNMALINDAGTVGQYSESITLSAANGFEVGKNYGIRKRAVVDGVAANETDVFRVVDTLPITDSGVKVTSFSDDAKADIEAEATDAIEAYDPPTKAEMDTALAAADDAVLAAIAALNNLSAAQVATEISDALAVDTRAELAAPPAANAPLVAKITWVSQVIRNKMTQSATEQTTFADNGSTPVGVASVTDAAGVVTRGEFA